MANFAKGSTSRKRFRNFFRHSTSEASPMWAGGSRVHATAACPHAGMQNAKKAMSQSSIDVIRHQATGHAQVLHFTTCSPVAVSVPIATCDGLVS